MKDVIVVVPTLLTGIVVLINVTEASWHRPGDVPIYLMFLAFLFVVLLVWYRSKFNAVERGKVSEVRRPVRDLRPLTPARALLAVGIGAPVGVCTLAWFASLTSHGETAAVAWIVAGLIAVTSLFCGTFLLTRLAGSPFAPADRGSRNGWAEPKPAMYDPDAIDLVGRRG